MDCEFSEFSYGYAAIKEAEAQLAQIYTAAGAPVLPSLLQEEKLGWDAKISYVEFALFMQFKRVEYVSRRHPDSPTWSHVGAPHYRYTIDTDGHQHAALVQLEASLAVGSDPGRVLYAAPMFHAQRDFDDAYSRGNVLYRSSLIGPRDFGVADGKHHLVTDAALNLQILSEPRRPETQTSWDAIASEVGRRSRTARERGRQRGMTVGQLDEIVRSSVMRLGRDVPIDDDAPVSRRLQRAAAVLGCGLLLFVVDEEGADSVLG